MWGGGFDSLISLKWITFIVNEKYFQQAEAVKMNDAVFWISLIDNIYVFFLLYFYTNAILQIINLIFTNVVSSVYLPIFAVKPLI